MSDSHTDDFWFFEVQIEWPRLCWKSFILINLRFILFYVHKRFMFKTCDNLRFIEI